MVAPQQYVKRVSEVEGKERTEPMNHTPDTKRKIRKRAKLFHRIRAAAGPGTTPFAAFHLDFRHDVLDPYATDRNSGDVCSIDITKHSPKIIERGDWLAFSRCSESSRTAETSRTSFPGRSKATSSTRPACEEYRRSHINSNALFMSNFIPLRIHPECGLPRDEATSVVSQKKYAVSVHKTPYLLERQWFAPPSHGRPSPSRG